ncbi:MAG: hypothetical protein IJL85_03250, partial [Erysipelotrichaceae bacterium]|nr:hypothetical protein [Erysipelotrichaceae bacterium]
MKKNLGKKLLSVLLVLVMLFSSMIYPIKTKAETKTDNQTAELITDLSLLKEGSKIVIVNKAHKKALSQTYNGYYNSGVDVAVSNNKIADPSQDLIWTIGFDSEGNYQIKTAEGKKLALGASYSSMTLDEVNDKWKITPVSDASDNDVFFIENIGRPGQVMEWFSSSNRWSCYNNNTTGELFQQQIYLLKNDSQPSDPVLASSVTLDSDALELYEGDTHQLKASVSPADTTNKALS